MTIGTSTAGRPFGVVVTGPRAATVRDVFADVVAAAVRTHVLAVDVEHVVLAGRAAALGRPLTDVVAARRRRAAGSRLLVTLDPGSRLRPVDRSVPFDPVGAALVATSVRGPSPLEVPS